MKTIGIEGRVVTAASAAAQKLGYSSKQMDVVIGIVSERDVFTTLITRYGKSLCYGISMVMVACPPLITRCFSYSLSQVRGILSLQPRHNGDSVAIAAQIPMAQVVDACPLTHSRVLRVGSGLTVQSSKFIYCTTHRALAYKKNKLYMIEHNSEIKIKLI